MVHLFQIVFQIVKFVGIYFFIVVSYYSLYFCGLLPYIVSSFICNFIFLAFSVFAPANLAKGLIVCIFSKNKSSAFLIFHFAKPLWDSLGLMNLDVHMSSHVGKFSAIIIYIDFLSLSVSFL